MIKDEQKRTCSRTVVFIVRVIAIKISLDFILSSYRHIQSYAAIRSVAHHICAVMLDKDRPNGWRQERLASGAALVRCVFNPEMLKVSSSFSA